MRRQGEAVSVGATAPEVLPYRIAIVESDPAVRAMLVEIFRDGGNEIIEAPTPEDLPGAWRGDVILTDTFSHHYDAAGATARIRGLRQRFGAAIVVLTAHAPVKRDERALAADAVIEKPFDMDLLLGTVERVVMRNRAET